MENITINSVDLEDVKKLQAIAKQTFFSTFSKVTAREDMAQYLETGFSLEKLTLDQHKQSHKISTPWKSKESMS